MTESHLPPLPSVPALRPRRLRDRDWTRRLVAENRLGIDDLIWPIFVHDGSGSAPIRSEEHTSELQSLMRISYAVFGLKKKTDNTLLYRHHAEHHRRESRT